MRSPRAGGDKIPLLITIARRSGTVHYRPELQLAGKETILAWSLKRFRTLYPKPLVSEDTADAVIACLAGASETTSDTVLCCNPEAAFVPDAVFHDALATHRASESDYTFADGLPRGIRIEYFRIATLIGLQKARGCADRPAALICEAILGRFTGNDALQCHIARHQVCLQPAPETIVIESRWDVETAARVVEADAGDWLACWMRVSAEPRRVPTFTAPPKPEGTLRVLLFSAHSGYSGAESALIRTVTAFDRSQVDPVAFIPMDGFFADGMRRAGCPVLHFEADVRSAAAENIALLNRLVDAVRPDVIHINSPSGLPLLAVAAARSVPCVQHLRTARMSGLFDPLGAVVARIAVSEYVRQLASDGADVHVIPDGIDTLYFAAASAALRKQARSVLQIPANAYAVAVAARLDPGKRHDLLIEAVRQMLSSAPETLLLIAGDDADDPVWAQHIDRLIAAVQSSASVRRLGFQRDIRLLYAAADVVVSCGEAEALGCSVLEAMSMGLPVVISQDGGQTEVIETGRSGLAFPSGDAAQLSDCLLLLRDPNLRIGLGAAARERIRKHFSIEATASSTLRVLANIARGTQASSARLRLINT